MTPRAICLAAAKATGGVCAVELAMPRATAWQNFSKLLRDGLVFKAGTHLEQRYFGTQEEANAFRDRATIATAPAKRSHAPMSAPKKKTSRTPGWGASDPMRITPATIFTFAPTPPPATRTNTYPVW